MNIQYKAKSYSNVSASALVLLCASFAQAYAYETLETNPEVLMSSSAAAPLVLDAHSVAASPGTFRWRRSWCARPPRATTPRCHPRPRTLRSRKAAGPPPRTHPALGPRNRPPAASAAAAAAAAAQAQAQAQGQAQAQAQAQEVAAKDSDAARRIQRSKGGV